MRDVRLMKLSLFLVNGQHGITMLTLIYFNLPDNEDVIAIVLAIPSYLCTVILSYLCGLISLKLKGYWKYLINLWTICYWILWVALMSRFVAPKYLNFIIVFAVVFFLIDMIMDSLETLLIYFSIKQGEEQIRLFACLAKWLSYRGFY